MALGCAVAGGVVVSLVILLGRPGDLIGYMQNHTAFFLVAGGLGLAAIAVLASLATLLQRRA